MKKMLFLLLVLGSFFSASSSYAIDENQWEMEEKIHLGEFQLGKAELTREMSRKLAELATLPENRSMRVYVRTNSVGDIERNVQLAEIRTKTVTTALRRIVPTTKLSEDNLEVITTRYDQDGVDAQGAWIEIYKSRPIVPVAEIVKAPADEQIALPAPMVNQLHEENWRPVTRLFLTVFIILVISSLIVNMVSVFPRLFRFLFRKSREKKIPTCLTRSLDLAYDDTLIQEIVVVDDTEFVCIGKKNEQGDFVTYHNGANGAFSTKDKRRWMRSVETTLRQWLSVEDKDERNRKRDFSLLLEAINNNQVMRLKKA